MSLVDFIWLSLSKNKPNYLCCLYLIEIPCSLCWLFLLTCFNSAEFYLTLLKLCLFLFDSLQLFMNFSILKFGLGYQSILSNLINWTFLELLFIIQLYSTEPNFPLKNLSISYSNLLSLKILDSSNPQYSNLSYYIIF